MSHIWQKVFDEVLQWHKATFEESKCTFASQLLKLEEELRELENATIDGVDAFLEETVDVLIVSYVLHHRYKSEIGRTVFAYIEADVQMHCPEMYSKIEQLVREKLEINKRRMWVFENGKYHHVEEITNVVQ